MIQTLEAVLVVEDATLVGLKDEASVDRNGERLLHQGGFHLLRVALSHKSGRGHIHSCFAHLVVLAGVVVALARHVRVGGLKLGHVTLVVPEGAQLNAAVASRVTVEYSRAADQLLLRER